MTIEQANEIKQWRCIDEYSWRSVALNYADKYNIYNKIEEIGLEKYGIELCDEAMKLLNETLEINPEWN